MGQIIYDLQRKDLVSAGGGGGGGGWSKKDKAKNTMTLLTFLKESIINHLDQMSLFQGRVPVLDSC